MLLISCQSFVAVHGQNSRADVALHQWVGPADSVLENFHDKSRWQTIDPAGSGVSFREVTWFTVRLSSRLPVREWLLTLGSGANLTIWEIADDSLLSPMKSGLLVPAKEARTVLGNSWEAKIYLATDGQQKEVLIRAAPVFQSNARLFPALLPYSEVLEDRKEHVLFLGLFGGILLFLSFYHLFYYFLLRDKAYLYHALFTISLVLFVLYHEGITYSHLLPGKPLLNYSFNFLLGVFPMVYTRFFRNYLRLWDLAKGKDRTYLKVFSVNALLFAGCIAFFRPCSAAARKARFVSVMAMGARVAISSAH